MSKHLRHVKSFLSKRSSTHENGCRRGARRRRLQLQQLETRKVLTATINVAVSDPASIPENRLSALTFTLTRDEFDDYLAVEFQISGDAVYDGDYQISESDRDTVWLPANPDLGQPIVGTVTFEPGESAVEIVATPVVDSLVEIDETIVLTVTQADEFDVVNGGASLLVDNQDTIYYVVDQQNRLGTVDVETGRIHVVGEITATQTITDIAITEAGDFFAITQDNLYLVNLADANMGVIPSTFLGFHNILNANALVDARDGDFGSGDGDLVCSR